MDECGEAEGFVGDFEVGGWFVDQLQEVFDFWVVFVELFG